MIRYAVASAGDEVQGQQVTGITSMSRQERFELLSVAAVALHSNGQASGETMLSLEALSKALGMPMNVSLRWDELLLQSDPPTSDSSCITVPALAANVSMNRVQAVSSVIHRICTGSLAPAAAKPAMDVARRMPPSSLTRFSAACIIAACALAILSGARYLLGLSLIAFSAGLGACFRRLLGSRGLGSIPQSFLAALFAGLVASVAVHAHVTTVLRILAVTPCMILVPGPHIINGSVDMLALRMSLGLARLSYAGGILGAICAGMLVGLQLGGVSLPIAELMPPVPLWVDVLGAGAAAASYGIFFSMPIEMLLWPVVAGMLAHAAHWCVASALHASPAGAAGVAGLVVGILLTPVAQRLRLPFAAIGFASVVSLMPGTLVFRMSSGLLQIARQGGSVNLASVAETLSDGVNAVFVVLALVLGLSLPQHFLRLFQQFRQELVI